MLRPWTLLLGLFVAACGGGGGDSGPGPEVFRVTQTIPADAAGDVPLTQDVVVVFSRPVDETSLNSLNLQVVAESGDTILGDRAVNPLNPTLARFLPRAGYLPFAVHTIRVLKTVRDTSGAALDRDYEFEFQTEAEGPVLPGPGQIEDRGNLLRLGRWSHRMTLLPSNRFLVAGGYGQSNAVSDRAENLVPALGQSFLIDARLILGRAAHVQVLLSDERVLLAGGEISDSPFVPTTACEIFDPATSTFQAATPMNVARSFAHGVRMSDGRVLVTGGQSTNPTRGFHFRADAELYDVSSNTWTLLASPMRAERAAHFSWVTPSGDVIVNGGTVNMPSADLWDHTTATFGATDTTPPFSHRFAASTMLSGGRALIVGGLDSRGATIWDPTFGFLSSVNRLLSERSFSTATAWSTRTAGCWGTKT